MAGASLAIDDCYELWESGFISIPYDFAVSELQPKLQALLAADSSADSGTASGGGDSSVAASQPRSEFAGIDDDLVGSSSSNGAWRPVACLPKRGSGAALLRLAGRSAAGRLAGRSTPRRPTILHQATMVRLY